MMNSQFAWLRAIALDRFPRTIAILAGIAIASCSAPTEGSIPSASGQETVSPIATDTTFLPPNVTFEVTVESGTCPVTVSLWELGWAFEGGADHTVVVDFAPIANLPVQIVQSEDRRVVYEAPLTEPFADCFGTAQSEYLSMYTVQFGNGTVQFDLDLTTGDGFREIRYTDISANRPYVHWRAAE